MIPIQLPGSPLLCAADSHAPFPEPHPTAKRWTAKLVKIKKDTSASYGAYQWADLLKIKLVELWQSIIATSDWARPQLFYGTLPKNTLRQGGRVNITRFVTVLINKRQTLSRAKSRRVFSIIFQANHKNIGNELISSAIKSSRSQFWQCGMYEQMPDITTWKIARYNFMKHIISYYLGR